MSEPDREDPDPPQMTDSELNAVIAIIEPSLVYEEFQRARDCYNAAIQEMQRRGLIP